MRKNRIVTLDQARAAFPSLGESAACAHRLKAAIFDGIAEVDMKTIMQGLVEKAKGGDLAATKLLLDFVSKSAPTPHLSLGVRANAAGQAPGRPALPGPDDEPLDAAGETLRLLVVDILRGDKLGKTLHGILQLLNQREDEQPVTAEVLVPLLDGMAAVGELQVEEGRYRLGRRFHDRNCA